MPEDEFAENYLEKKHPKLLEICFPFVLGIIMLFIRDACRTFIFKPVGKYFGIAEERIKIPQNEILENVYARGKILDNKMIAKLSRELQWPKKEIKEWFKLRLAQEKHLDLEYFSYCSWRLIFAIFSFTYGLFTFWNKPWLWDIKQCYYDYPFNVVTNDMWWYYMLTIAYYWGRHILNRSTKNFMSFYFHDLVFLFYLHLSWYINLVKLGILIIIGMGFSDIIVEMREMIRFTSKHILWDIINAIFVLIWVLVRNYIFPVYIVYNFIAVGFETIQITQQIVIMYFLLVLIVILDGVWISYHLSLSN